MKDKLFMAIIFIFILYFAFSGFKNDLYLPIENFIINTSRNSVVLNLYQPTNLIRVVQVLPFDWYIINENGIVYFMLDNGIGKNCGLNSSPAVAYHATSDLSNVQNVVECITPAIYKIKELIEKLPHEQLNYETISDSKHHVNDLIKFLINEGIFTFYNKNTTDVGSE
ncbi:MAG: hypothetical protein ACRYGG_06130 [Janthinobacterium lividum]